ncbi:MAG TPA: fumarylacetoacetate hydrolase family protein [Beijerinckiaceae bacterium]|nr:fumarylacetoacetate hydrolase family protein [Beijerinckiaceae bacterium]
MKFATLRTGQVVAETKDGYRRVDAASMIDVIENYPSKLKLSGEPIALPEALAPPIARPSKIWAAAGNFYRGVDAKAPDGKSSRGETTTLTKEELLHSIFLKPPSAIIGPGDSIVIPPGAGGVFPEVELCVVIGKRCRGLTVEEAASAIFGYSILLDVTARNYGPEKSGKTMRCIRKGYDTFAPFGPGITTRDEIPHPDRVQMNLRVNGELRQSATTETMINGVYELVSFLSKVCTLEPGDLISTGTPDSPRHQQRLVDGDTLVAEIEGIGKMKLGIRASDEA